MTKIAKALDRHTLLEEDLRNLDDEGCEDQHERGYWDECYMCDHGSLNVAALGTVDFNGRYTA